MVRFRTLFLAFSAVCLLLVAGLLRAGLGSEDREDLFRSLGVLTEVVHLVENEYVDELNDQALSMALDAGLLESVDPWAAVVPEIDVDTYRRLVVDPPAFVLFLGGRLGLAAVRFAIPGSPASEAELQSWEVIEKVGDVYTRGRPLWQIRLDLARRETAGESVNLTVVDRHVDERRDVVLQPDSWSPDSMEISTQDGVQIVKLNVLDGGVAAELKQIVKNGVPVVIDLRKLVWGSEEEAVAAADVFVDDGVIGRRSGRQDGEELFEATEGVFEGPAPVVLIGPDTEGVGEILASALGRHGSPLVGWKSAGHAPHMQFVHSGGLHLWIPVAQWLGDDGEPITGAGVEPTHEVEFFEAFGGTEDDEEDDEEDEVKKPDAVLVRGIEIALEGVEPEAPALADAA